MENYVAIVLESEAKAFNVLHELWRMHDRGTVIVNSAAVMHRDAKGRMDVVTNESDAGERTLVATAAGLLIGAIAAAASVTAIPLAVGTVAGAAAGLTADAAKSDERRQAATESQFVLPVGKAAVVAGVNEESTSAIDTLAAQAGGKIYRRTRSTIVTDRIFGDDSNLYLYPYDCEPGVPAPK